MTSSDERTNETIAKEYFAKVTRRRQRKLSNACLLMGMGIALVGIIAWGMRLGEPGLIVFGAGVALVFGLLFGLFAIVFVPLALGSKSGDRMITNVFLATSVLLVGFTISTGMFPFFPAGVALTVVILAMHITTPNVIPEWSPKKCVSCGYDVSGTDVGICPECGLTESGLASLTNAIAHKRRASGPVVAWLLFVLAAWIGSGIWVHTVLFHH